MDKEQSDKLIIDLYLIISCMWLFTVLEKVCFIFLIVNNL